MAKRDPGEIRFNNRISDGVQTVLDAIARFCLIVGGAAAVIGVGVLLYQLFGAGGASPEAIQGALKLQDYFRQAALFGLMLAAIGAAWAFWGEETAGPIMLIVGLGLALSSWYVPMMGPGGTQGNVLQGNALAALSMAGYPVVIVGFVMVVAEVVTRVRIRVLEGARAEQMKYGKGVKEERDIRNVFMGKCWQLPYCRKFVRERCPIYHSKRTCWKERVGCMCEESVINNAMSGKTISTDMVAAAKFIPQNHKLNAAAKAERCRQCVIYNEHQKHKYKLFLPMIALGIAAGYIALREPMSAMIKSGLMNIDKGYKTVILTPDTKPLSQAVKNTSVTDGVIPYHEIILFVLTLVTLAYAIKLLEYFVWKLKV